MQEFNLPKLPENYRWSAETRFSFKGNSEFHAPDGFVIKSIDLNMGDAICVAMQTYVNGTWVTISTK